MKQIVIVEGLRSGTILGACAIALALPGLAPALSWVPEIPLVAAAILVPIGIIGWTGVRATSRSRRLFAGPLAGGLTGAVGGFVGGLTYFSFGKSALNIGVGLVAGTMAGVAMGFVGAIASSTGLIVRSDR